MPQVQVDFVGNPDDLVADSKKVQKELDAVASKTTEANQRAKMSWTDVSSVISLVGQGLQTLKKSYDFAREGAQIEFLQGKFDQLAVSIGTTSDALLEDLKEATRGTLSDMELMAAAGDLVGLGLANTHDEAVRLAKVSAGLNMNMNQLVLTLTNMTTMRFDALGVRVDGFKEKVDELKASGLSADEAFKEAFLQQAEQQLLTVGNAADTAAGDFMRFEAQMKNLADEAKMFAADALGPLVSKLSENMTANREFFQTLEMLNPELKEQFNRTQTLTPEMVDLVNEYRRAEQYSKAWGDAVAESTQDLEASQPVMALTEEQIKAITKANQDYLGSVGSLTDQINDFTKTEEDLKAKEAELLAEKQKLIDSGWWAESDAVLDVNKKLEENASKQQENADSMEMATRRRVLAMLEERLAVDGLDAKETDFLLRKGVAWGLYSQTAVNELAEIETEVAILQGQFNSLPTEKKFTYYIETVGSFMQSAGGQTYQNSERGRASGGPVMQGQPYVVGERGPEMFVPNQSGNIVPNNRMDSWGGTNVTVNLNGVFSDPERIAYQLAPAIKRVLRTEGVTRA